MTICGVEFNDTVKHALLAVIVGLEGTLGRPLVTREIDLLIVEMARQLAAKQPRLLH